MQKKGKILFVVVLVLIAACNQDKQAYQNLQMDIDSYYSGAFSIENYEDIIFKLDLFVEKHPNSEYKSAVEKSKKRINDDYTYLDRQYTIHFNKIKRKCENYATDTHPTYKIYTCYIDDNDPVELSDRVNKQSVYRVIVNLEGIFLGFDTREMIIDVDTHFYVSNGGQSIDSYISDDLVVIRDVKN